MNTKMKSSERTLLLKSDLAIFVIFATLLTFTVVQGERSACLTYGFCGETVKEQEAFCKSSSLPKPVSDRHFSALGNYCPELVASYGNELCCNEAQIVSLGQKLLIGASLVGKCPSCFRNLRQTICEVYCSPNQHQFLNITEARKVKSTRGKEMVLKMDGYISERYMQETFNSCEKISAGQPNSFVLDIFCGKWRSAECSAMRWFEFVGSASTQVIPFDVNFNIFGEGGNVTPPEGKVPYNFNTTRCDEAPPGEVKCDCGDCPASCPAGYHQTTTPSTTISNISALANNEPTRVMKQHNKNCVMYGFCGETVKEQEGFCKADHLPKNVSEEYMDILEAFCPEMVDNYGSNLCCDEEQILNLTCKRFELKIPKCSQTSSTQSLDR